MANYSIVIGSKFKPFSYQELLHPVMTATQAQQQVEEAYANMALEAELAGGRINEQVDKEAYKTYKAYSDELSRLSERLARNGLTPEDRKTMYGMRARYAKEISPIEEAVKRRNEDVQMEYQARLKDPTLLLDGSAAQVSIDDYLKNPNIRRDKTGYSGAVITKQVSDLAQYLGNQITQFQTTGNLDPYTKTLLKKWGVDPATVMTYLQNPSEQNPLFDALVNTVLNSTGIGEWADNNAKSRALYYARQGIAPAMGKSDASTYEDFGSRKALELSNAIALENVRSANNMREKAYEAALAGAGADTDAERGTNYLEASGDLAAYNATYNNLTTGGNGALKASYFGKTGKANPIQVYDEIQEYAKKHPVTTSRKSSVVNSTAAAFEPGAAVGTARREEDKQASLENAKKVIMQKYGITSVVTPSEYKHLKELGYTKQSTFSDFRNGFKSRIDNKGIEYTHSSVNLPKEAMADASTRVVGALTSTKDKSGIMWEMNPNGTLGKPIKGSSIQDLEKATVTDVYYGQQGSTTDKIHLVLNGNKDVYVSPTVFRDDRVVNVVNWGNSILSMKDPNSIKRSVAQFTGADVNDFSVEQAKDYVQKYVTSIIRNAIRGYNKGRSKTDSKI